VAKFDDLKVIEAEPFEPSTVHAAGGSVEVFDPGGPSVVILDGADTVLAAMRPPGTG
jgi:hypothetical protein